MVTSIETITGTIEYRPLNALTTWPRNYRDGDVGAIITSILKFGFNGALRVWRDDVVMAGNHTLLALQSMQAQQMDAPRGVRVEDGDWLVPCVDISHLNETQAQAFAIADNRTTELAQNDPESLANLLQELALEDTALLEATGYDGDDLDALLVELGQGVEPVVDAGAQVDRAAELQEKWQTERGQVWQVGRHRIMCGDSTDADDVARLMDGAKADAVVTDVPYGISQQSNGLRNLDYGQWDKGNVLDIAKRALSLALNAHTITAFCREDQLSFLWLMLAADARTCRTVAWVKPNPTVLNGQHVFLPAIEVAAHGRKSGAWFGGKCVRSVWEGTSPINRDHPTQKPLELFIWIIKLTCQNSGIVYDPFLGSGTTLVACEQTGRVGYGMEIDAAYVAVALERLAGMGLEPRLTE